MHCDTFLRSVCILFNKALEIKGPGPVILNTIVLRDSSFIKKLMKKQRCAILMPDHENPYSGKLPKKLEVGESIDLFVNFDKECFLSKSFTQLGVYDSFDRPNWASKKTMKELREKWLKEFGENT